MNVILMAEKIESCWKGRLRLPPVLNKCAIGQRVRFKTG
jgi:hypothetical protein